jgi:NAD-dependent deacetylase
MTRDSVGIAAPSLDEGMLEKAASILADARSMVVFTGAGMSSESGVRTFRGADGWWREKKAEDLATVEAIREDPVLVWEWYGERLLAAGELVPHAGYLALFDLQEKLGGVPVITQNVDGLHGKAGMRDVLELHGNLRTASCIDGCSAPPVVMHPGLLGKLPPRCRCGAVLRPDVVLFGESLPPEVLARAFRLAGRCDVMLVIGTSLAVYPAGALPVIAIEAGARVIEINPEDTPLAMLPRVTTIRGGAGEVLPLILRGA